MLQVIADVGDTIAKAESWTIILVSRLLRPLQYAIDSSKLRKRKGEAPWAERNLSTNFKGPSVPSTIPGLGPFGTDQLDPVAVYGHGHETCLGFSEA